VNAAEIRDMNRRIAERWATADQFPELPVRGPNWCGRVIGDGQEILGVHGVTGAVPASFLDGEWAAR
jgi:hypothetical protein